MFVFTAFIQLTITLQLQLTDKSEMEVIATVNINIGLGKNNPSLVIKQNDSISVLVNKLIMDYNLPKKVYSIIMDKVKEQLGGTCTQLKTIEEAKKKVSVSPIRARTLQASHSMKKITNLKENDKNGANQSKKDEKRLSPSPLRKGNEMNKTKVGLNRSKTPVKDVKQKSQKSAVTPRLNKSNELKAEEENVKKLFKSLIKSNPSHIRILSPQYIDLKGMNRTLLSELQQFFQLIEEAEFDKMTEHYFVRKIIDLGFINRLGNPIYYKS